MSASKVRPRRRTARVEQASTGVPRSRMAKNGTSVGTLCASWLCLLGAGMSLLAAAACSGSTDTGAQDAGMGGSGGSATTSVSATSPGTTTSFTPPGDPTTSGSTVTAGSTSGGITGTTTSAVTSTSGGTTGGGGNAGTTSAGQGGSGGAATDVGAAGAATDVGAGGDSATSSDGGIAACEDGMAASCPSGTPLCAERSGGSTGGSSTGGGSFYSVRINYSFCTETCQSADDCNYDLTGVSAAPNCGSFDGSNDSVCSLDCSLGRTCPEGMECQNNVCMYRHCTCTGDCTGSEC